MTTISILQVRSITLGSGVQSQTQTLLDGVIVVDSFSRVFNLVRTLSEDSGVDDDFASSLTGPGLFPSLTLFPSNTLFPAG